MWAPLIQFETRAVEAEQRARLAPQWRAAGVPKRTAGESRGLLRWLRGRRSGMHEPVISASPLLSCAVLASDPPRASSGPSTFAGD